MSKPPRQGRQRHRPIVRRTLGAGFESLEDRIAMSAGSMTPVAGNWDGVGADGVGFYDRSAGQMYLRESNSPGFATLSYLLATPTATLTPLAGDWDGNGTSTVGLYNAATGSFGLRNQNLPGAADIAFSFGGSGNTLVPLSGDWNGDGRDSIGVFDTRTGTFALKNALQAGAADYLLSLSAPASELLPLAGDWDGDGRDSVGVYNMATGQFAYCNNLDDVAIDQVLSFGTSPSSAVPLAGDWNGDGRDTIGLYDTATAKFTLNTASLSASSTAVFYVAPAVAALTASEATVLPASTQAPALGDSLVAAALLEPAAPVQLADTTEGVLANPLALVGASPQITLSDVDQLLKRAAAASSTNDAIIAIVDRNGNILGVRMEQGVLDAIPDTATRVFAIDGAVAKARTAALFANGDPTNGTTGTAGPLTSRTVRFISQSTITQREVESNPNIPDPNSTIRGPGYVAPIGLGGHFPPGVMDAPVVDLFGIEHTNRDSLLHPGLDSIKGTADDIALPSRFNVDPAYIPPGQQIAVPESFGVVSGLMPTAQARGIATLPGGIPLYKTDAAGKPYLVGGIGVFFPGTTGYATYEQGFVAGIGQTEAQRTNASRVLEAEYIAFAAAGGIRFGTLVSGGAIGNLGTVTPVPPVPGFGLVNGRIDLAGITLEIYGPGNPLSQGPQALLAKGAQVGQATNGLSGIASQYISPTPGQPVPDGWLVLPHGSGSITTADVQTIINQGISEALLDRSAIRLQLTSPNPTPGARTRMTFSVSDKDGNILGLYRMQDGTVFSIDVAVAKSRNTAYYANPAQLQPIDRVDDNGDGVPDPSVPAGTSFTNRTFRFLAEPRYPSGIDGTGSGAFSIMRDPGFKTYLLASRDPSINSNAVENIGAPQPASVFTSAYGFDSFHPARNFHDPYNIANQNGVVFFPGSTPLYKNSLLAGGFGVSGDGVDQDDVVTYYGSLGFQAPTALRADQFFVRNVRLVYQNFPRNPRA